MFESIERYFKKGPSPLQMRDRNLLSGCHVAILATNGFEQSELFSPKAALEDAGAIVHIVSLRPGKLRHGTKVTGEKLSMWI